MRQLTESAVSEVVLDGQNLPLCRGEVRNLEHGPEPDVLPAMHGSSGAIADRADSISSFKLRSARHAPLRSLDATTARVPAVISSPLWGVSDVALRAAMRAPHIASVVRDGTCCAWRTVLRLDRWSRQSRRRLGVAGHHQGCTAVQMSAGDMVVRRGGVMVSGWRYCRNRQSEPSPAAGKWSGRLPSRQLPIWSTESGR